MGFLPVITTRLAEKLDVGINPVSGFYHDHLFVPGGRADEVVDVLRKLGEGARAES